MKNFNISNKSRKTFKIKLLKTVFSIYLIITLLVTFLQLTDSYFMIKEDVYKSLEKIQIIFETSLTNAVWSFDGTQLKASIEGIMNTNEVVGLEIRDIEKPLDWRDDFPIQIGMFLDKNNNIIFEKTGNKKIGNIFGISLIQHSFNLVKDDVLLGRVVLYSSNQVILEKISYQFFSIVIAAIIKTAVLWLLFIWAFDKYLTKTLDQFCETMEQADIENIDTVYLKLETHGIDELCRIESAYNAMFYRVIEIKRNIDLLNKDLDIQVKERTYELELKNETLEKISREKSNLMSIAAHDLKNPLFNIVSFSYLIEKTIQYENNKEKLLQYNNFINTIANNMFEIINNLIDVEKIELGEINVKLTQIDLLSLVKALLLGHSLHASAKNIKIDLKNINNDYVIVTDQLLLSQIINNIVSNAIKYSPIAGEIFIELRKKCYFVELCVADHGPGISNADKDKLFSKFCHLENKPTNNETSTGLGLFIVKKFSDLLGITVTCLNNEDKGCIFILKIPVNQ